jgi:hypothetical protein
LAVAEAELAAEPVGNAWVEKVELAISAPGLGYLDGIADPTMELAQSMRANGSSEAFRSDARDFMLEMMADLPPGARGGAHRGKYRQLDAGDKHAIRTLFANKTDGQDRMRLFEEMLLLDTYLIVGHLEQVL